MIFFHVGRDDNLIQLVNLMVWVGCSVSMLFCLFSNFIVLFDVGVGRQQSRSAQWSTCSWRSLWFDDRNIIWYQLGRVLHLVILLLKLKKNEELKVEPKKKYELVFLF